MRHVPVDHSRWLRRRRWIRRGTVGLVASAVVACVSMHVISRGDDWANYDRRAVSVRRVISGDVLQISGYREETIRLVGVVPPGAADAAERARAGAEAAIGRRLVFLRLETLEPRDAD